MQRQDRFEDFEPKQCKKCREYITELDDKYFGGVILAKPINPSAIPKTEPMDSLLRDIADSESNAEDFDKGKRKRGRPKGSKNKNYYPSTLEMLTSEETKGQHLEESLKQENDENNPDVDNERILVHPNPDYIYGRYFLNKNMI